MRKIDLFGVVGEDFTPTSVRAALPPSGDVLVSINSGGGYAADGAAIYQLLLDHPGNVTVDVIGIAASAASVVAMAGDQIIMADGAVMMIHDPLQITIGNSADHAKTIEELETYARAYARIYARRAGISTATARMVMQAETWFDGPEAVAAGFATRVGSNRAKPYALHDYAQYRNGASAMARIAKGHPQIVARGDATKAAWARTIAKLNGEKPKSDLSPAWQKVIAHHNASRG